MRQILRYAQNDSDVILRRRKPTNGSVSQFEKERKSERRMPRLPEAMKDVVSCEKVRGSANRN